MREEVRGGKFSALAERELLRDVSARIALYPSRLKDEPRQGFLSVQFFERVKPLFGYCLRRKPLLLCVLRRAVKGF